MKFPAFDRIACLSALVIAAAFYPSFSYAGWSSLHGNNRNAPAPHAPPQHAPAPAPRPAPGPHPEPHPAPHPEPRPVAPHPEPRPVIAPHPDPRQVHNEQVDRQRMDIAEERRQSYYWSDYHPGMRFDHLPTGYLRIGVRNHPYFFFQGVFYDNGPSGYVVVAPPVGAAITGLPPGTETIVLGDTYYYYVDGAFYVQQPDGTYVVVAPPIGVTVSTLPPDASSVTINGINCYQSDGACYQPVMQNGVVVYLTVAG